MFMITILFPNSCMIGFEYMEESEEFTFNEFNIYLFVVGFAYRWRSDGKEIKNMEL